MLAKILYYLPMVVAPFVLFIFTMISAYVFKFNLRRGGLGFDYTIFAILVIVGLKLGGAI